MSHKRQIFKLISLKRLLNDENSCVSLVPTKRLLALPPFFLNDMRSGILYILNSMLKKYDRSLDGIVIGYQNIKVLFDENTGIIPIGTSETEVNISVEFYLFQPKIGSFLEGVVNKISNNHIGCLVHQYFNATILKPEEVDCKDWICKDYKVDDRIVFKVKDLDFTSVLPSIEGVVNEENFKNCDTNNVILSDVKSGSEILNSGRTDMNETGSTLECNVNRISCETESFRDSKKKKSKKKKEETNNLVDYLSAEQEKCSNSEMTSETNYSESKLEGSHFERKKKKKKKKKKENHEVESTQKVYTDVQDETQKLTCNILEEYLAQIEDENSNDFIKPMKSKKDKKKEKEQESLEQPTTQPSTKEPEDNVLCSTLLDPKPAKKLIIPTCSPIISNEKKKKHKKRKREEGPDETPSWKKMKLSSLNSVRRWSDTEKRMKEVYKQNLNRLKEDFNISDKETKKKKEKKTNGTEETDILQIKVDELLRQELNRIKELNVSNSPKEGKKKKKKSQDTYQNGSMYHVTDTPEKNFDKSLFTDSENSHASPAKRKKEVNGSLVSTTLNDFLKKKKEKKRKAEPEESLYEKLLKEAKSLVQSFPKKKK